MPLVQYRPKMHNKRVILYEELKLDVDTSKKLLNPDEIVNFIKDAIKIHENTVESVYMLCMDSVCHVTGIFELSRGAINESIVSPRDAILSAMLLNSYNVVLIHNHPSGDATPSGDDYKMTKRFIDAFDFCGMLLLDHIIIGDNATSIRSNNADLWYK